MASGMKFYIEFEANTAKASAAVQGLAAQLAALRSGSAGLGIGGGIGGGRGGGRGGKKGTAGPQGLLGMFSQLGTILVGARQGAYGFSRALGSTMGSAGVVVAGVVAGLELLQIKLEAIKDAGMGMLHLGIEGFERLGSFVVDMMKSSSQYEMTMKSLQVIGKLSKQQAFDIGSSVREIVAYTPFMERSLLDLANAMIRADVSADQFFGKTTLLDAYNQGITNIDESTLSMAKNMKMNALTSLTDFIASTKQAGIEIETYFKTMQRYLQTGKWSMRAPISPIIEKQLEAAGKKGIGAMLDAIQKVNVEKGFVGFSAAASSTIEGIVSNFKEVPEQIYKMLARVGDKKGPYERIKAELVGIFSAVQDAFRDEDLVGNVREGMEPLTDIIVNALQLVAKGIKFIADTVKNNPGLTKFIGVMILVVPTILTVVGALTAAIGVIGAFAASLAVVGVLIAGTIIATVVTLGAALLPIIIMCGLLTVAVAAVGVALGVGIAGSWNKIATLAWKISTLIKGVVEALWNWEGATSSVSTKTAIELEKSGMAPAFFRILGIIYDMQKAITSVYDRLSEKGPGGVSTLDTLKDTVDRVLASFEGLINSITTWFPRANEQVGKSGGMFGFLATMIEWGTSALDTMVPSVAGAIKMFADLYETIAALYFVAKAFFGIIETVGHALSAFGGYFVQGIVDPRYTETIEAAGAHTSKQWEAAGKSALGMADAFETALGASKTADKMRVQATLLGEDYRQRQEKDKRDKEKGIKTPLESELAAADIKQMNAMRDWRRPMPGMEGIGGYINYLPSAQAEGPSAARMPPIQVQHKTELIISDIGKIARAVNEFNLNEKGALGQPTYGESF